MKRRTTRKKQQELIEKRKRYFTDMICGIVLFVLFIILSVVSLYEYNQKPLTYDDVEYKEFIFESFETRGSKTREFWIYVKEEEQPLIFQLPKISYYSLFEKVNNIENGSKISCYVKPNGGKFSYTVFELKGDEMVFSLDFCNEQNKRDALIGLVSMPILTVASLVVTLIFANKYKKIKC